MVKKMGNVKITLNDEANIRQLGNCVNVDIKMVDT